MTEGTHASSMLNDTDMEHFLALVDTLSSLPVCQIDQGLELLLEQACSLIGADDAFWMAAAHQPDSRHPLAERFNHWIPVQIVSLENSPQRQALRELFITHLQNGHEDPFTESLVAGAGEDRALLRSDVLSPAEEQQHWMTREIIGKGLLHDRMVGASHLSSTNETYLGFDRHQSRTRFGARERNLMRLVCVGLKWFFSSLHRSYGLIDCDAPPHPAGKRSPATSADRQKRKNHRGGHGTEPENPAPSRYRFIP